MQFVKGKPPETQYATHPGARAKRREAALGRPGFEPGRIARMAEFKAKPSLYVSDLEDMKMLEAEARHLLPNS
jgi:hypothetical protein